VIYTILFSLAITASTRFSRCAMPPDEVSYGVMIGPKRSESSRRAQRAKRLSSKGHRIQDNHTSGSHF
jgi:hypothetical protein